LGRRRISFCSHFLLHHKKITKKIHTRKYWIAWSISETLQPKLWAYTAGIASNHGMRALAIGGIEDHVHALISLPATMSIAEAVQLLKANPSGWTNRRRRSRFEWQEGYFACSVSRSQIPRVSKYIANQREHHKERDFAAEFRLLLKRHGFEESAVPMGL
jgi:putative transposase